MTYRTLHFTVAEHVATITLDHPPANLLSRSAVEELHRVFNQLGEDPTIRCIIVTGAGRFFSAGADIHELAVIHSVSEGMACAQRGQQLMQRIEESKVPVIAAINGTCVGGGLELALACHIRLAAEGSLLGLPEIKLGLIPGFGGTQRLPRLIGSAQALEMMLTGELIPAERARTYGLVNHVIPGSQLEAQVQKLADSLASFSRHAVRSVLQAFRASEAYPISQGMTYEAELFGQLCSTPEKQEGIQAFLEHRPPKFEDTS
ncbi:MAG: enoyl-CoA hydratase [Nitrospirae bacterium]|nr:MAG: enoyl-CoA hydratase [Nitrospirota bacterium]